MKFEVGDKVIITHNHYSNSINCKGEVSRIRYPISNESLIWYIIDYTDNRGELCSSLFKDKHIALDKEWYRNQKIAHVLQDN